MLLALDIGNTNIKTGIFKDNELIQSFRLDTNVRRTADEYGVMLVSFFNHIGISTSSITGIIMSSVIPSINYTIEHMCRLYFGMEPLTVSSDINIGIKNYYENPNKLGSDRICSAVAANKLYRDDLIVIDFGTATSFNVISKEGDFLGGVICPGLKVSAAALTNEAALLPKFELDLPEKVIGTNTVDAIQAGVILGYVGMVEYLIKRINEERGIKHKVIATGGMSNLIALETDMIEIIDPILTLEGLSIIARLNGLV